MKKVFLFLLASVAMVSCGSDDDNGGSKKPSSVVITSGNTSLNYNFSYDNKSRMSQMVVSGSGTSGTILFTYGENGKASNMTVTSGGTTTSIALAYDAQKRLSTITEQGQQPVTLTWTGDNSFTYSGNPVLLTDKGDVQSIQGISIMYDNGKKGMFSSVKSFDPFLLTLVDTQSLLFASKMPINSIVAGGDSITYTNTFEGGYVKSSLITTPNGNANVSATY
ncbi:hypothetical protein [Flavobacterium sp.]|uniref:hypothetical protein n=1 Tax=Flavobacterium sp. TaxID=239 RepID=UPI0012084F6E|nr:hypothetical protein [Flavobacterium sp.]RZJ69614.1 MAG: hypothetical protein EOO49_16825 [Flavobacterium sp.]